MIISRKDRERQLKYASRQSLEHEKMYGGYFYHPKYTTGVLACPGVRLRSLAESDYSRNYLEEMRRRIYADRLEKIDLDFK